MSSLTTSTTTREPFTHTVEVGKADYTFVPDIVLAEIGDYVKYEFYPRNHSVVRADYEFPCVPYELVNTRPGFYSGFHPVDTILDDPPIFTVRVNDTEPIFVYCSGPHACIEHGMVAVVNPNANTSLDHHRQMAMDAAYVLQPGDPWPAEGPESTAYNSATSTASPTTATWTPTPTTAPTSSTTSSAPPPAVHQGLSTGAIAGIAIGGAAVLLLAAIALWLCGRRSVRSGDTKSSGGWFGGNNKKNPYQNGDNTGAPMPPAYNSHGMPLMVQNKAYPGSMPSTSIVEHYVSNTGSPSPQMSPYHAQQSFPPHITNPTAFGYNSGFAIPPEPNGLGYPVQQNFMPRMHSEQTHFPPEIYSGTPAPLSQHVVTTSAIPTSLGPQNSVGGGNRNSLSTVENSRGGSPDILAEMNAAKSQAGTLNQGGGGILHQPTPSRIVR